jgi:hypothetical protein
VRLSVSLLPPLPPHPCPSSRNRAYLFRDIGQMLSTPARVMPIPATGCGCCVVLLNNETTPHHPSPEPSLVVYQPNPAIRLMTDDPLPSPARAAHDHCHCHAPTRPDPIPAPAPDTDGIKCRHSHSRTRAATSFHIYLSCRTVPPPSSPSGRPV